MNILTWDQACVFGADACSCRLSLRGFHDHVDANHA